MSSPDLTEAEIQAVNRVLSTPYLSFGPQLKSFETAFASDIGTKYAVGVNSGTSGLHLCAVAAGIGKDDLAITTPFSFIASSNIILYEQGIPIFVDVESTTGNMDTTHVEECVYDLMKGKRAVQKWLPPSARNLNPNKKSLKSILPVHAFGQPVEISPLLKLRKLYNLSIIEDACEAIGAEYKGRKVGTFGDAAVFAFYPNKQMTTGEGGMIVTSDKKWSNLFLSLRNQGRDVFNSWLEHTRLGYNYRLDEMSAALGLAQLKRIEELLEKRDKVAKWYTIRLENQNGIRVLFISKNTTKLSWFVYVIRLESKNTRDRIMKELAKKNIPSRPYFSCIHLQPFYRKKFGYRRGNFPIAEELADVSLALPFSGVMNENQVDYVCQNLINLLQNIR